MKNTDIRVDAYIETAPEYAQPILNKLRKLVHRAHPGIEEHIKWGMPSFEHKGRVVGMAAFKKHVSVVYWNATKMKDPENLFDDEEKTFSIKFGSLKDMPADKVIVEYTKEAVALNDAGVKMGKAKPRPAPRAPKDLAAALKKNKKAAATYKAFSPTHKREYVEWITGAKREATREKRLAQAIEWMAEGKPRNWKYMKRS